VELPVSGHFTIRVPTSEAYFGPRPRKFHLDFDTRLRSSFLVTVHSAPTTCGLSTPCSESNTQIIANNQPGRMRDNGAS